MATMQDGTDPAMSGTTFGKRAGAALDALIPEKNRDKVIARMFGVSPRMARYLRAGERWSVERLSLASAALGREFNELLIPRNEPLVPTAETSTDTIERRLAKIETQLTELLMESRRLREQQNDITEEQPVSPLRVVC
jgi:hypothetical protein